MRILGLESEALEHPVNVKPRASAAAVLAAKNLVAARLKNDFFMAHPLVVDDLGEEIAGALALGFGEEFIRSGFFNNLAVRQEDDAGRRP